MIYFSFSTDSIIPWIALLNKCSLFIFTQFISHLQRKENSCYIMLKYKQEEDKLEKYIEENDEKLQHMNQDTHNAIIALMGSQILEGIENEEGGEIRVESKALQAIQRRGEIIGRQEGEILKLIEQTKKKMQRGDTQEKIADDLMEEESVIQPIYEAIKQYPDKTKEEIYKMLNL